jgi:thioredoxin reductase
VSVATLDTAIIGAGPYGLSLAAHLRGSRRSHRIFGSAMSFWSNHMPQGMCLKSEGFASDLYDPDLQFSLKVYCAQNNIPYADIGLPVPRETFIAYSLEFQRRYVPQLENTRVTSLARCEGGFELTTEVGEIARARHVVVAVGLMNFTHLPRQLYGMEGEFVTHSSQHSDLSRFKGRRVAVLGAGASAVDLAALLHQAGAQIELIARRESIDFHPPPKEPRSLFERVKAPRSGLGVGWRSRMCTDIPLVFYAMPQSLRLRVVEHHLGPAPCWFVRDAVSGHVPMHLGAALTRVRVQGGRVCVTFKQKGAEERRIEVNHLIAATGYKVAMSRLGFIDQAIQARIRTVADTPILNRHFESSVPGLYFIGITAANSFGPLLRFAYGARFAAQRVARRLGRN